MLGGMHRLGWAHVSYTRGEVTDVSYDAEDGLSSLGGVILIEARGDVHIGQDLHGRQGLEIVSGGAINIFAPTELHQARSFSTTARLMAAVDVKMNWGSITNPYVDLLLGGGIDLDLSMLTRKIGGDTSLVSARGSVHLDAADKINIYGSTVQGAAAGANDLFKAANGLHIRAFEETETSLKASLAAGDMNFYNPHAVAEQRRFRSDKEIAKELDGRYGDEAVFLRGGSYKKWGFMSGHYNARINFKGSFDFYTKTLAWQDSQVHSNYLEQGEERVNRKTTLGGPLSLSLTAAIGDKVPGPPRLLKHLGKGAMDVGLNMALNAALGGAVPTSLAGIAKAVVGKIRNKGGDSVGFGARSFWGKVGSIGKTIGGAAFGVAKSTYASAKKEFDESGAKEISYGNAMATVINGGLPNMTLNADAHADLDSTYSENGVVLDTRHYDANFGLDLETLPAPEAGEGDKNFAFELSFHASLLVTRGADDLYHEDAPGIKPVNVDGNDFKRTVEIRYQELSNEIDDDDDDDDSEGNNNNCGSSGGQGGVGPSTLSSTLSSSSSSSSSSSEGGQGGAGELPCSESSVSAHQPSLANAQTRKRARADVLDLFRAEVKADDMRLLVSIPNAGGFGISLETGDGGIVFDSGEHLVATSLTARNQAGEETRTKVTLEDALAKVMGSLNISFGGDGASFDFEGQFEGQAGRAGYEQQVGDEQTAFLFSNFFLAGDFWASSGEGIGVRITDIGFGGGCYGSFDRCLDGLSVIEYSKETWEDGDRVLTIIRIEDLNLSLNDLDAAFGSQHSEIAAKEDLTLRADTEQR